MDPTINQEWTSFEVEEARSLIARLNNSKTIYSDNDDKNKKHKDIVDAVHAVFPSKTIQQVTKLYVDLVVEMHMMEWREESHVTGGSTHNVCTVRDLVNGNFGDSGESGACGTHAVCTAGDLVKEYNLGVQDEVTTVGDTVLAFGCPLEDTRFMDMEEALPMVEKNKMEVFDNNISNHKPAVAAHQRRFWTIEEHRLFLHGLRVYGRGDWKNISKYFVTTKTAVQVSSHAQKYFKRLEKRTLFGRSRRQRYSINDVGLHDDDPCAVENSSVPWQALAFTGLNNGPSFGSQAPASSFVMNDLSQFLPPIIYSQQVGQQPVWNEERMMGSVASLIEGVENFVPSYQQGSAYFPPGNL